MSRFVWFRIAIRLLGLWFISSGLPAVIGGIIALVEFWTESPAAGARIVGWLQLLWPIGSLLEVAAGIYFLFFGQTFIRWCLRDVDNTCGRCGYDTSGVKSNICPECGMLLTATPPPAEAQRATDAGSAPGNV